MDVKEAVQKAVIYVADLFSRESPENIGLEEVELDSSAGEWKVTIGFSRPWNTSSNIGLLGGALQGPTTQRQFKVIRINNETGEVTSIKIRES